MAPYIALLILLIVVILFSVYTGTDGFTNSFSDTATFQEFMDTLRAALQKNKELKQKLDSSTPFDDTLTIAKLREIGLDRAPGERPFSRGLSVQMETDDILINGMINMFERALQSGTLKSTDLLKTARANVQVESVVNALPRIQEVLAKREVYINSKVTPASTTATTGTTGTAATTGTTGTAGTAATTATGTAATTGTGVAGAGTAGNAVGAINMNDLFTALTGSSQAIQSSTLAATPPAPPRSSVNSLFGTAPATTMASTKEMEDRIAKSVATQLKDSLLAKRATETVVDDMACPYSPYSNAVAQGQDYRQMHPIPSKEIDMSEYIRKDSIPCWNCSL